MTLSQRNPTRKKRSPMSEKITVCNYSIETFTPSGERDTKVIIRHIYYDVEPFIVTLKTFNALHDAINNSQEDQHTMDKLNSVADIMGEFNPAHSVLFKQDKADE